MKKITKQKICVVCWLFTVTAVLFFIVAAIHFWNISFIGGCLFLTVALIWTAIAIIFWVRYLRIKRIAEKYNRHW